MVKKSSIKNLVLSLIIDLVGMANLVFPFLGEFADLLWSPISAFLLYLIYKNEVFAIVNGIEELLPMTDIIPTATLCWIYYKVKNK